MPITGVQIAHLQLPHVLGHGAMRVRLHHEVEMAPAHAQQSPKLPLELFHVKWESHTQQVRNIQGEGHLHNRVQSGPCKEERSGTHTTGTDKP